ncbi:MAG: tRNA guanosine(15) transglycosylase TgtA [Candidatus Hermodarchaeota archaeon]
MEFEVIDVDALGRIGRINLNHKELITPNLLPVIHPFKNIISTKELTNMGVRGLFTNAYIIYQNKQLKNDIIVKGIHKFFNFNGVIATDSGAFQQYMYGNNDIEINAEEIENFQEQIKSDLPVILDVPVELTDDYKTAECKVNLTIKRAKDNMRRRKNSNYSWIGPIHGGNYLDLLKKCTLTMSKLEFNIYAIGGLVKAFLDYRFELTLKILLTVKKYLPPSKPLHMFGLGLPQFFSLAVACGCDLMDSAAYILFAKENRYFSLSTGTNNLETLEEFPCHCPVCINHTPKELKSFEKNIRTKLIAMHNLYTSFSELSTIRQSIREGNLWELVEQRIRNHPNLVKAARYIKKNRSFLEIFEKLYKKHGRLYNSFESLYRPNIYRYIKRLSINYRVPNDAKYLIILPELDIKATSSPSIKRWLREISNNKKIQKEVIHIVFCTEIYGILPYELLDTFPMGQYESIKSLKVNDMIYQNSLKFCLKYFKKHSKSYIKCALLIPESYINQFNEIRRFPIYSPINGLKSILKPIFKSNLIISPNIDVIINFFSNNS